MDQAIPIMHILHVSNPSCEGFLYTNKLLDVPNFRRMPKWTAIFNQAAFHGFVKGKHDANGYGMEHAQCTGSFLASFVSNGCNMRRPRQII